MKSERTLDIGPSDCPIGFTDSIDVEFFDKEFQRHSSEYVVGIKDGYGQFVQGAAEGLPYKSGTFDKVNAGQVLLDGEGYADIIKSVREVSRVLKLGGIFHVRTQGAQVAKLGKIAREVGLALKEHDEQGYDDEYEEDWVDMTYIKTR